MWKKLRRDGDMKTGYSLTTLATLCLSLVGDSAYGDALVVTKAMNASTIAEVFVEDQIVRIKLEIGVSDLASFQNILPDDIYTALGNDYRPLDVRLEQFFSKDLVLRTDEDPLPGRVTSLATGKRISRDEITGEPLTVQPTDSEQVVFAELEYTFESRPSTLILRPPLLDDAKVSAASIGFVAYHKQLPVNDFRYFSSEATLDLDWSDAWYSRFRHPSLRRKNYAPISAYLYVEPYEVRKEIIVRPKDLQEWIDLGLREDGVIPVDKQEELKKRVSEFLAAKNPVRVDGLSAEGRLDRIHFIHRTLRATGIIEPAVDLDSTSATLGVIFVYPVDRLPERVSMKWELFSPKIQSIPAAASDEAGGLPAEVTPGDPVLEWNNFLTNPTSPQMLTVAHPPSKRQFAIPVVSVFCGGLVVVSLAVFGRQWSLGKGGARFALAISITAIAVGVISLPFARVTIADPFAKSPRVSDQAAEDILSSLLHNVYRSFDHHDENLIYDRLSKSISGELLSEVYLETRQSMEVKNQGGLRISVKEVAVTELESVENVDAEPTFRCRWRVSGWIGHWGHIHRRENEHVALLTIAERGGMWKITDLEKLDEQPREPSRTSALRRKDAGA